MDSSDPPNYKIPLIVIMFIYSKLSLQRTSNIRITGKKLHYIDIGNQLSPLLSIYTYMNANTKNLNTRKARRIDYYFRIYSTYIKFIHLILDKIMCRRKLLSKVLWHSVYLHGKLLSIDIRSYGCQRFWRADTRHLQRISYDIDIRHVRRCMFFFRRCMRLWIH